MIVRGNVTAFSLKLSNSFRRPYMLHVEFCRKLIMSSSVLLGEKAVDRWQTWPMVTYRLINKPDLQDHPIQHEDLLQSPVARY